uniref:Uncharacterized protein n=1 Tax=Anguilla anguilla TaxID=7936 RepID=A0A0E9VIJ9_ANGAN
MCGDRRLIIGEHSRGHLQSAADRNDGERLAV